ncbi:MAG: tetratricopeptide repeat protein [Desulfuromonadales bacterium]
MTKIGAIITTLALAEIILSAVPSLADYQTGMGAYRVRDYKWAMKEFKADPNRDSCYSLGVMYFKGEGVKADHLEGIDWFRKAADQGHSQAQFLLGTMYDSGKDVIQDRAVAAKWYVKAAEQGHVQAQFNIGLMYVNGEGVEKNRDNAVAWLKKAAGKGHHDAGRLLKTMGEEVPPQAKVKTKAKGKVPQTGGTPSEKPPGHP